MFLHRQQILVYCLLLQILIFRTFLSKNCTFFISSRFDCFVERDWIVIDLKSSLVQNWLERDLVRLWLQWWTFREVCCVWTTWNILLMGKLSNFRFFFLIVKILANALFHIDLNQMFGHLPERVGVVQSLCTALNHYWITLVILNFSFLVETCLEVLIKFAYLLHPQCLVNCQFSVLKLEVIFAVTLSLVIDDFSSLLDLRPIVEHLVIKSLSFVASNKKIALHFLNCRAWCFP